MLERCLVVCLFYLVTGTLASLVPFIQKCKPEDSQCIKKSTVAALPHFLKGIKEFDIPPLEPLKLNDINAETGELKMSFRNAIVSQLSKCDFDNVSRDAAKMTVSITVTCPIIITGEYTLSGKLLFLDIEGDGKFSIQGGLLRASSNLKLKEFKDKEGKKHYKVSSFDYSYEPLTPFELKFENLFNGDKAKAEPVENLMKQNWKDVMLAFGDPVIKECIHSMVSVTDNMFKIVPLEDLEIV